MNLEGMKLSDVRIVVYYTEFTYKRNGWSLVSKDPNGQVNLTLHLTRSLFETYTARELVDVLYPIDDATLKLFDHFEPLTVSEKIIELRDSLIVGK